MPLPTVLSGNTAHCDLLGKKITRCYDRPEYLEEFRELAKLALISKRLTAAAQEMMYKNVSLPQLSVSRTGDASRLPLFLRTLTERQDLVRHVQVMAIWVQESKTITEGVRDLTKSSARLQMLLGAIERITPFASERYGWMKALETPTEALLCALIFAALPNLKTIQLCAKTTSPQTDMFERFLWLLSEGYPFDMSARDDYRLVQGLRATNITSLDFPNRLTNLPNAKIPSLKALALEYDGSSLLGAQSVDAFPNLDTLIIQLPQSERLQASYTRRQYDQQFIQPILASFPKLRTVGVLSCIERRFRTSDINLRIEKLVIHQANMQIMVDCISHMDYLPINATLRRYELHFLGDEDTEPIPDYRAELLMREGVETVVKKKGKIAEVLGAKSSEC